MKVTLILEKINESDKLWPEIEKIKITNIKNEVKDITIDSTDCILKGQ